MQQILKVWNLGNLSAVRSCTHNVIRPNITATAVEGSASRGFASKPKIRYERPENRGAERAYKKRLEENAKKFKWTPSQKAMVPSPKALLRENKMPEAGPLCAMQPSTPLPVRAPLTSDVTIQTVDFNNQPVGSITLPKEIFLAPIRTDILHRVVVWQLACKRRGNGSSKTRSEVRGGGRKPHKQKGLGAARAGSNRAPQWVGGGVVFGPKPRDFSYDLPSQVKRFGLKSALSAKLAQSKLVILETSQISSNKTKALMDTFKKNDWENALIVDGETVDANLQQASNNVETVEVLPSSSINVYSILHKDKLIITKSCVDYLKANIFNEDLAIAKRVTNTSV